MNILKKTSKIEEKDEYVEKTSRTEEERMKSTDFDIIYEKWNYIIINAGKIGF